MQTHIMEFALLSRKKNISIGSEWSKTFGGLMANA